ncbi:MAG: hypothetical protein B6229_09440 [Spirochaetaceae bacterium 4572_7]|nr:MAG: hypothetical protein B6229_09440 [Spirochaetaceae bacterium 4572_7]
MFNTGLIITLVGMLGVFVFLILLVISMGIMSKIIQKYLPEKVPITKKNKNPSGNVDIAISIAAIKSFIAKENK